MRETAMAAETSSAPAHVAFDVEAPGGGSIACRIDGWSDDADAPSSESVVQAACGLMSVHGRATGGARTLGVPYVSVLGATLALQGACAAALGRTRGGSQRRVGTSLAAAALLAAGQYIAGATARGQPERLLPGATPPDAHPPFISADGVVFELETLDAVPWRQFWTSLDVGLDAAGRGWQAFLQRYAKAVAPLPGELSAALAALPFARIAALGAQTGVAVCPVRTLGQRARDADIDAVLRQGPWTFTRGGCAPRLTPLAENESLPLAGLSVIESCRRIQGPLAGHLLATLGARVIRIEPPGGDPLRDMPPLADGVSARFHALNRMKDVHEIDIKSARGRDRVRELVRGADVFLHNWAPGKAEELELDAAALAAMRPGLVYAYAGGWGADNDVALPGTDFVVQAYSGVAERIGATGCLRGGTLFTALDVLGGAVASQGVVAALLARQLDRRGVAVESSLLGAAASLCADELAALRDDTPYAAARPLVDGVFETRDGCLALTCADRAALESAAHAIGVSAGRVETELAAVLRTDDAHAWQARLNAHGVPASAVAGALDALQDDPRIAAHLAPGSCTQVLSPWRFS
ncbi:CoA transferase [Burkholderia gladioli]|nr:CoA transferase [Burkholderia gladioli]